MCVYIYIYIYVFPPQYSGGPPLRTGKENKRRTAGKVLAIPQAEHILHSLSSAPLYPHFHVGWALTCHLRHVSSSPLRL